MIVTFHEEQCIKEYSVLHSAIFTFCLRRKKIPAGTTFDPATLAREVTK